MMKDPRIFQNSNISLIYITYSTTHHSASLDPQLGNVTGPNVVTRDSQKTLHHCSNKISWNKYLNLWQLNWFFLKDPPADFHMTKKMNAAGKNRAFLSRPKSRTVTMRLSP